MEKDAGYSYSLAIDLFGGATQQGVSVCGILGTNLGALFVNLNASTHFSVNNTQGYINGSDKECGDLENTAYSYEFDVEKSKSIQILTFEPRGTYAGNQNFFDMLYRIPYLRHIQAVADYGELFPGETRLANGFEEFGKSCFTKSPFLSDTCNSTVNLSAQGERSDFLAYDAEPCIFGSLAQKNTNGTTHCVWHESSETLKGKFEYQSKKLHYQPAGLVLDNGTLKTPVECVKANGKVF